MINIMHIWKFRMAGVVKLVRVIGGRVAHRNIRLVYLHDINELPGSERTTVGDVFMKSSCLFRE